jgi:hypothetical protein
MNNEPAPPVEPLSTVEEVALLLRRPPRTIRHFVRRGQLKAIVFPDGELRFESGAIAAFVEKCRR